MKKTFCDICEKEIKKDQHVSLDNYSGLKGGAQIKVEVEVVSTGDFCRDCIVEAIKEIDGY